LLEYLCLVPNWNAPELDYILEELGGDYETELSPVTGASYLVYKPIFDGSRYSPIIVVRSIGHKGENHAAIAATQMISDYHPSFIVNIGLSGSLNKDAPLGTIIVADSVTAWAANSRIEDHHENQGFQFRLAGETFRSDKWLADRASNLRFEERKLFGSWTVKASRIYKQLNGLTIDPSVIRGDVAAGPSVGASSEFKQWLLEHKRDYLAIDMESSGVAAAGWSDAVSRTRIMIIRATCDLADQDKSNLETTNKLEIRRAVMKAATRFYISVLQSISSVEKFPW
jgi:nucleoside phosphorylase